MPLVVENHESWVQREREQHVRGDDGCHWHTRSEPLDIPTVGSEATKIDHAADHWNHQHVHPLETRKDLWQLLEEIRVILLFGRSTPIHINAEHVRKDGHQDVKREPTKEDDEEGHPLEILN